jgi:hypothetical protein
LTDYRIEKLMSDQLDEVTVFGGRVQVDGEGVRAAQGVAVPLRNDRLVEGSETVRDYVTGDVFDSTQYDIDYDAGRVTALASPPAGVDPIPDGLLLAVSYRYQPSATVEAETQTAPIRTETIDIPSLRTESACALAAQQVIRSFSAPEYDATATVRGNVTYSPVAALASSRLPTAVSIDTVDIEADSTGATVRLSARRTLSGVVSELRDRIQAVARNVN